MINRKALKLERKRAVLGRVSRAVCWRWCKIANNFSGAEGVVRVIGEVSVIYRVSRGDGPLLTFCLRPLSVSLQRNSSVKNENENCCTFTKSNIFENIQFNLLRVNRAVVFQTGQF